MLQHSNDIGKILYNCYGKFYQMVPLYKYVLSWGFHLYPKYYISLNSIYLLTSQINYQEHMNLFESFKRKKNYFFVYEKA